MRRGASTSAPVARVQEVGLFTGAALGDELPVGTDARDCRVLHSLGHTDDDGSVGFLFHARLVALGDRRSCYGQNFPRGGLWPFCLGSRWFIRRATGTECECAEQRQHHSAPPRRSEILVEFSGHVIAERSSATPQKASAAALRIDVATSAGTSTHAGFRRERFMRYAALEWPASLPKRFWLSRSPKPLPVRHRTRSKSCRSAVGAKKIRRASRGAFVPSPRCTVEHRDGLRRGARG